MGLWYQEIKGNGRTMVFLHGAGSNHSIWRPYLSAFRGDRVMLVDLPGHGHSQHTPFRSIQDAAQELISVLKKAAVQDACVVGQSLGGLVGLEAAARAPQLFSMIAVSSPLSKGLIRAQSFFEATASWLLSVPSQQELPFQDYSQASNKWFFLYPFMDFKGTSCHTIGKVVLAAASYSPPWNKISQPVLILHGSRDPFLKKERLREHVKGKPKVRVQAVPTHHLVITHTRDQVVDALKRFFR